jgi:membrane protease YdiL (CAAX protease family)
VSALLMGLLFGWLVHLTGDLGAPIAAHFTINYMNLRYIARTELPAELADNGDSNGDSEPEAEPVVP